MGHTIEFVIWWLVWAAVITVVVGVVALIWRRIAKRSWSDLQVAEAALAVGLVISFVAMIVSIAIPD